MTGMQGDEFMERQAADTPLSRPTNIAAFLHAVPGGIFIYSADEAEEFTFVSDNMLYFLGYTQEEFTEKFENRFSRMVYRQDRDRVLQEIEQQIRQSAYDECEYRIERRDGSLVWVHDEGHLVSDENGKKYFYVVIVDITASVERFQQAQQELLSANPQAMCLFWLDLTDGRCLKGQGGGHIIQAVQAQSVDRLLANILSFIIGEEGQQEFCRIFQRERLLQACERGEDRFSCIVQWQGDAARPDGYWTRVLMQTVQDPRTSRMNAVLYLLDVDEEKKQQLISQRLTYIQYEKVALIDGYTGQLEFRNSDRKGHVTEHCRPYGEDSLQSAQEVLPAERQAIRESAALPRILQQLRQEGSYVYAFSQPEMQHFRRKQWSFCWLDGEQRYILAAKSDITEVYHQEQQRLQQLEEALQAAREADAARSVFLSNVSHDMRTPLNGIIGFTDLALGNVPPERMRDYLQKIRTSGQLLLNLIDDTLHLSRLESGSFLSRREVFDGAELMAELTVPLHMAAQQKNIRLQVEAEDLAGRCLRADRLNMQKIFLNLLSNAIKFTPAGGLVELLAQAGSQPGEYVFLVRDTGIGISEDFLPHIFEPFMQEHMGGIEGTGLGLAIVKRLVRLMEGRIEVSSQPGAGTEFRVTLPLETAEGAAADRAAPASPEAHSLRGCQVLLCEDNELNMEIAQTLLEQKGMGVHCAANGQEGLQQFQQSPPGSIDIVLMDLRMPVMNGYEAVRSIRALPRRDARSVPILAMSADAYPEDVERCLQAGMNGHIAKPVDPQLLFRQIARFCGKRP